MGRKGVKSSGELSTRCKIFLDTWIILGYEIACKRSGYSKNQIWRIVHDPRAKVFMSEKFKEIAEEEGWSLKEELKELKRMIKDPRIPGSSRIAAQERFCDRFEDQAQDLSLNALASYEVFKLQKPKETKLLDSKGDGEKES